MSFTVQTRIEAERGCGYRKGGGKYMMGGRLELPCGKLPHVLDRCPCCDQGIKPARGWTWIAPQQLFLPGRCTVSSCRACSLREPPERAGLLWIGGAFYPDPDSFTREAARMGISRRIIQIPRGFKVGETLVLIAHRDTPFPCEACGGSGESNDGPCSVCDGARRVTKPAIFAAFVPTALEYVVKGDESDDELQRLVDQGFDLINVVPDRTIEDLFDDEGVEA